MIGDLVEYMAKGLVREADKVSVAETATGGQVDVSITVAPDDYGRLIGRSGQTINAVRAVAEAAGRRNGLSVMVDVVEPGSRPRR